MSSERHERLPFEEEPAAAPTVDEQARDHAVDPARNVVLEASAGTGKTRVLVDRYINLLRAGVDPANILAITFTRKAAAEMRARIVTALRERASRSPEDAALWRNTRDRAVDIGISTIDAFCLSLLREFPLEADLDPGFAVADETEVPRLIEETLDRALRVARQLARSDDNVKLVFAQLGERKLRNGLASLLHRRLVADTVLRRALEMGPADLTAEIACARAFQSLRNLFGGFSKGLEGFLQSGPVGHPHYALLAADLRGLCAPDGAMPADPGVARAVLDRIEEHFLVKGKPRKKFSLYRVTDCVSPAAWKDHLSEMQKAAADVARVVSAFRRDVNALLSRGVWRIHCVTMAEYGRTLEARAVLDFPELLLRALKLLGQMDEFSRSRFRLESRYHHVLVDEFQDTSRAQWDLIALLIRSWAEGMGLADDAPLPPSIFLVGDRKQSIYAFRDADLTVTEHAAAFVDGLRPDGGTRRAISKSFRAVPQLLDFANDLFDAVERADLRVDAFRYDEQDRFPVPSGAPPGDGALGVAAGETVSACADRVAEEIRWLIESGQQVRDPLSRELRPARPADIAILFRSKDSHREFETALEARQIPTYVYKGLGFFEAEEIKDVVSLLRYLAAPASNGRAAAFMRSRFVRLSDPGLRRLAPQLANALTGSSLPEPARALDQEDRQILVRARSSVARWLSLVDRIAPADLLQQVLSETAYLYEIRGPRMLQARENLKKMRSIIRRVQNRGYVTLGRIAEHLDRLSVGDESNAVIDAVDAVSLMTVHAAKGLEFPIVFLVNLNRGTGGQRPAIRVGAEPDGGEPWVSIGDFQSEMDEDAKARDREETKRILYVAVTRARDRLYLASVVKDSGWKPAPGSLGEVLPGSFKSVFEAALGSTESQRLSWTGRQGREHPFRVCAPASPGSEAALLNVRRPQPSRDQPARIDDFGTIEDPLAIARAGVTASIEAGVVAPAGRLRATSVDPDQTLVGTLVHRLFEHSATVGMDPALTIERLRLLIREQERAEVDDLDTVLRQAGQAYLSLCSQPAVAQSQEGDRWFEVPFSVRPAGGSRVLRGTFDCLVRGGEGQVTVLEFKTGAPSDRHTQQLEVYVTAARALFPGSLVEGKLVYAGGDETKPGWGESKGIRGSR